MKNKSNLNLEVIMILFIGFGVIFGTTFSMFFTSFSLLGKIGASNIVKGLVSSLVAVLTFYITAVIFFLKVIKNYIGQDNGKI